VYAATDGCGLWRFDGTAWQKVSAGTDMFATRDPAFRFAPISYPDNLGRLMFVFDRQTGKLWESNNQGSPGTWVQAWQVPPAEEVDASTGFMVDDPNDRGTVWLTTGSPQGLHQLSCPIPPVLDGCVDAITPPANVVNPGPISLRPCPDTCTSTLYVATRAVEGDPTPVVMFKHLSGNTSWCDLTSAAAPQYRRSANFPTQVAASLDSSGVTTVYVTTAGEGILVVSDGTTDCVP
jgi:hypothetical protein